jgi:hypothetical protein
MELRNCKLVLQEIHYVTFFRAINKQILFFRTCLHLYVVQRLKLHWLLYCLLGKGEERALCMFLLMFLNVCICHSMRNIYVYCDQPRGLAVRVSD